MNVNETQPVTGTATPRGEIIISILALIFSLSFRINACCIGCMIWRKRQI